MTYALNCFENGEWNRITAEDIISKLDKSIPLQSAWANYVSEFLARGERYSGESGDILSGAYGAIGKSKIEKWNEGFVGAWA